MNITLLKMTDNSIRELPQVTFVPVPYPVEKWTSQIFRTGDSYTTCTCPLSHCTGVKDDVVFDVHCPLQTGVKDDAIFDEKISKRWLPGPEKNRHES